MRLAGLTAGMRIEAIIFLPAVACQIGRGSIGGAFFSASGNKKEAQQSAYDMLKLGGHRHESADLWPLVHPR